MIRRGQHRSRRPAGRGGRAASALLAGVALAALTGALLLPRPAGKDAGPAPVRLQTPILSLRREPAVLARTVANLRLGPALDAVLADAVRVNPALAAVRQSSCLVVDQGGTTLYSYRATEAEIPASNMKLLTAAAVLERLGPTAHLVTEVRADQAPAAGTVAGNVYLVGGGDPLLRTPDYVATLAHPETVYTDLGVLARQVRAAGVVRITGGVVGDESRYDTLRSVPSWKPSYVAAGEAGPLSALQVNDGFASIRPGVAAARPAVQAATAFTAALRQAGVVVDGPPGQATTPATAVAVTSVASPPLADTVAEIMRQSDNTGAELLTKELGRAFGGAPTTAAGLAVIRSRLQADGLPVDQMAAVDGSGLDRTDRASCQLILDVLDRAGPASPLSAGLPVAARSGTLEHRLAGTPAAGRLRAKTGTLSGVAALSGFVDPPAPAPAAAGLTFSLILNGLPNAAAGDALGDRIATVLAMYPEVPPVDQLAPLPALPS